MRSCKSLQTYTCVYKQIIHTTINVLMSLQTNYLHNYDFTHEFSNKLFT